VQLAEVDLTGVNLTSADFTHAVIAEADLTGANLADAKWPEGVAAPAGWVRDSKSGRLSSADGRQILPVAQLPP
jgi:uncharacterized protein YjbI with pentapeptide repeats